MTDRPYDPTRTWPGDFDPNGADYDPTTFYAPDDQDVRDPDEDPRPDPTDYGFADGF